MADQEEKRITRLIHCQKLSEDEFDKVLQWFHEHERPVHRYIFQRLLKCDLTDHEVFCCKIAFGNVNINYYSETPRIIGILDDKLC